LDKLATEYGKIFQLHLNKVATHRQFSFSMLCLTLPYLRGGQVITPAQR